MTVTLDKLFAEPTLRERPLRILVYGLPKHGKSHFVFTGTAVGPLYWIDTEGGSDFYDHTAGHGFRVLRSTDPAKAIAAIEAASAAVKNDERPVVAVDSFSSIWFAQQEVAEELTKQWSRGRGGDRASFRAWGPAKKPLKKLYSLLMTTRCHVVLTARAKMKYAVSTSGEPTPKGLVADMERNLAYAVDLVMEFSVDELAKGKLPKPTAYTALVVGSRSDAFPIGTLLRDPKLADLLPAMSEGEVPTGVVGSVDAQVLSALTAPTTWAELKKLLTVADIPHEEAKAKLQEEFGPFNPAQVVEYWEFLLPRKG